jgi:hypothetical protein
MLRLVMTEVERMANDPLPVVQRAPRIGVARLRALPPLIGSAKWVRIALKNACGRMGHRSPPQPPGKALTAHRERRGRGRGRTAAS